MEFKKLRNEDQSINETTIQLYEQDGKGGIIIRSVPCDPENRHYAEYLRMVAEENYEAYDPEEEVVIEGDDPETPEIIEPPKPKRKKKNA